MTLPFVKAQAVGNDFLIVEWFALEAAGLHEDKLAPFARRICHRQYGLGADGLEVLYPAQGSQADCSIRIFNSDGSEAEISGNGTRCVAAYLFAKDPAKDTLRIATKAGLKRLRLKQREAQIYLIEMDMGQPQYRDYEVVCELDTMGGPQTVTLVDVGNPQCVLFVETFPADWRELGREIENHPRFPCRSNVSFVRVLDRHTIEVRFWERGAGETMSSGTGSTGAVVAAMLAKRVENPVRVVTPAGDIEVRWEDEVTLKGPAELTARGEYYWSPERE